MTLPETADCVQCGKKAWIKDTPWGEKQYSHKAEDGTYHNNKVKDLFPGEKIDMASYDAPVTDAHAATGSYATARQTREKVEDPDWEAIARGKVRHGVFTAVIQNAGLGAALASLPSIEKGVDYVMNGLKTEDQV